MATTHDLLIVTDATMSMGSYLDALQKSIPEILTLTKLSGVFSRIGVLAYKDYTYEHEEVVLWSGWNNPDLDNFVKKITKGHGGDFPEAAKTAMIHVLEQVDERANTLVLWYTDAPPHHPSTASHHEYPNDVREMQAFPAPGALDWVKLCQSAQRKNCAVFCFTPNTISNSDTSFYVLLSALTGGLCINTKKTSGDYSTVISRVTLGVMLQWMGQSSDMNEVLQQSAAAYRQYSESPIAAELVDEGRGSLGYLPPSFDDKAAKTGHPLRPLPLGPLTASVIPRGSLSETSFTFGKRFADPADKAYKDLVYTSLAEIIQHNVFSLTYNPIFGKLWRAVCKNEDERKNLLLNAFSISVSKVTHAKEKETLNQWLEDSFDATEEIEQIISRAEPGGAMVYLDLDANVDLTRTELLEVSKSCYAPVLKKVATLFTRLKLVEPGVTLTATQRAIPLSLSPAQFFRVLPHLVVPGTIYPFRAAAMTAILSLITAVPFLRERATEFLAPLKGTWLNLEVPENVSYDCARFLLSAPQGTVLDEREKEVYKAMRRYRLIELNSESVVSAQVPWTPHKTTEVGDRKVKCQKCNIARSVTLMSGEQPGVCGLCIVNEFAQSVPTDYPEKEEMASSWVECSAPHCHAQYVVENPRLLNIRPRCHYCRNSLPCPYLECTRCTNRIIVPEPYRAACKTLSSGLSTKCRE
ncbi:hypothetical protein FIBSPDRAFT_834882 [Athelia psychrophila]|uniref:VWFA domain-containing protein n=1 Tax=Athelia psychrophila TaxID=1759441 RepID=A0A166CKW7_9AGAM|nr:hypothetical protein FIBSPDRAFT_834882 [Fibularhizoctonia sp. CBS 109695]